MVMIVVWWMEGWEGGFRNKALKPSTLSTNRASIRASSHSVHTHTLNSLFFLSSPAFTMATIGRNRGVVSYGRNDGWVEEGWVEEGWVVDAWVVDDE